MKKIFEKLEARFKAYTLKILDLPERQWTAFLFDADTGKVTKSSLGLTREDTYLPDYMSQVVTEGAIASWTGDGVPETVSKTENYFLMVYDRSKMVATYVKPKTVVVVVDAKAEAKAVDKMLSAVKWSTPRKRKGKK